MAVDQGSAVTTLQQAYCYLCERILSGHYLGGVRASSAKVADELGISRMPLCEAIRLAMPHLVGEVIDNLDRLRDHVFSAARGAIDFLESRNVPAIKKLGRAAG